jgi:hypothetical protein
MAKQKTRGILSRREFIKAGAAGLGVATLGTLPGKVFGAAPAVIKGTKLTILQGTYFIARPFLQSAGRGSARRTVSR